MIFQLQIIQAVSFFFICDNTEMIYSCMLVPLLDSYVGYLVLNCSPWNDAPYSDAAERTDMGYISLNGFLSQVR